MFLDPSTFYVWSYGPVKYYFLAKRQANASSALVIEVMMIPQINVKNSLKFTSVDSRMKEDMKLHIS